MKRPTLALLLPIFALPLGRSAPARADSSCGDLLIVLDRSGSMALCQIGGTAKEVIAKKAITGLASSYAATPMGLAVFPDTIGKCPTMAGEPGACKPGTVVVDVAADGPSRITSFLDRMPTSCGGTPTGPSMEVVRDYAGWTPGRRHFALVITDGQPTCEDGDGGGKPDPKTGGCTAGMPGVPCNGGGQCECTNPTRVFDAVKALADKGIHTFVVGFAGKGMGLGCTGAAGGEPFNPETLNKMAELGGEPQEPPAATKFYAATDAASLDEALKKILGKVAGGTVGGCAPGGSGGSGGPGGAAGAGGAAGQGGASGAAGNPGPHSAHGAAPGCACRTPGGSAPALPAASIAVGLAIALRSITQRRDRS